MVTYKKFDEKAFDNKLKEGSIRIGTSLEFLGQHNGAVKKDSGYLLNKSEHYVNLAQTQIGDRLIGANPVNLEEVLLYRVGNIPTKEESEKLRLASIPAIALD